MGWVNLTWARDLPGVSIGVVLFLLLGAVALHRSRFGLVAVRTDRRLRLQDRLVTFLDFRGREDVDPEFRAAQAGETAAAIARADLVRGVSVPRLLWGAPLLFGWMLYLEYFPFFVPFSAPVQQQVTLVADPHRTAIRSGDAPHGGAARDRRASVPAPEEPQSDRSKPAPDATAPAPVIGHPPPSGSERTANKSPAGAGRPGAPPRQAGGPAMIVEPAELFSEPVGAALTPIADFAPGASGGPPASAPQQLRGRISFNLIPVDSGADGPPGTGGKPGGGKAEGLAITVDYDAVPPEYRPHVRRYFEALVRMFQGGNQDPG